MSPKRMWSDESVIFMVLLCFVVSEAAKGMRVFITTKANFTRSATVMKNDIACGKEFVVAEGEEHMVISTTRKKSVECNVTFTSQNSKLGMFCPKFYLKSSCSTESLLVNQGNDNITKYCGQVIPNLVSSGDSLSLYYKRRPDKNRNCNFGFICQVYSIDGTSSRICNDVKLSSVTPKPTVKMSEVEPSGRAFCSMCGWTVNLSSQTQRHILSKSLQESNSSTKRKKSPGKKSETHKKKEQKMRKKKKEKKEEKQKKKKKNKEGKQQQQKKNLKTKKTRGKANRRETKVSKGRRKQRAVPVEPRIVGGSEVFIEEYPWAVALIRVSPEGSFGSLCGGSLITSSWIISAAHCFLLTESPSEVMVGIGTKYLPDAVEDLERIVEIVLHPDFKPWETFSNDASLIRLEAPVVFTSAIVPICVANTDDDPLPTNTTSVVGWGLTASSGVRSAVLRAATLSIISLEECESLYEGIYTITSVMLCTYTPGRDACQGDSGGGLVRQTSDGRWVLVGIVSFGKGCADEDSPGVYARVSSFVSWINETIGNSTCS